MTWRFPARQWRSRLRAMGGLHMAPPNDLDAAIIPYAGAPAVWTYPSSSIVLTLAVAMTPLVPTIVSGVPANWRALNEGGGEVALPVGLAIDAFTGILSGTPTVPQAPRLYVIAAHSRGGPAYFRLTIEVA